jgi:N6-L-threonylcarbamoyladenine synthase
MITLGIETSCDETALAIIETRANNGNIECRVISSMVNSQADLHANFGGVFPSLAKREHSKNLLPMLKQILIKYNEISNPNFAPADGRSSTTLTDEQFLKIFKQFSNDPKKQNSDLLNSFEALKADSEFLKIVPRIDRIAVTEGPGLEPALWVGITFARIISALWSIPLVPVNHMEGHIMGSLLDSDENNGEWQKLKPLSFPAIALLISGGHTELVLINNEYESAESKNPTNTNFIVTKNADSLGLKYTILGKTKDDAVGEAFDKTARLLGLPYPGGQHISRLAKEAVAENILSTVKLPRPMIHSKDFDFSFSGLKTAVLYAVRDEEKTNNTLGETFKKGLAREFEASVRDTLDSKLRKALEETGAKTIIVGGGVSANHTLREAFEKTAREFDLPLYLPLTTVSGDNALMIALAGALDTKEHIADLRAQGTMKL